MIIWNSAGRNQPIVTRESDAAVIRIDGLELHCKDESELKKANEILNYLQLMKMYYRIPPTEYENVIAKYLYQCTGLKMDWENPRTIQEKIQWMKLYDSTPLKTLCADKFRSKDYVARKIGLEYVIPLLGVWDSPDEINLDELPNQFVLKTNHGCGMNIIVKDKSKFDLESAKEKLRSWLAVDYGMFAFEFHYCKIPRKIIAEEFIEISGDTPDYKFYCFNGEPKFMQYLSERSTELRIDYFDLNWDHMDICQPSYPPSKHPERIQKPKNFEMMIDLSKKLSESFSFVRVDFYEVNGKIYFGELTFTPAGGIFIHDPPEWNEKLGDMIQLPKKSEPFNPFK